MAKTRAHADLKRDPTLPSLMALQFLRAFLCLAYLPLPSRDVLQSIQIKTRSACLGVGVEGRGKQSTPVFDGHSRAVSIMVAVKSGLGQEL